jgi:UPF0716 protein FxsA
MVILALIAVAVVEVFVFIEVGLTIGWVLATVLLVGTSLLGVRLLRIEGRSALRRVSSAASEGRPAGGAALNGALGFLGCILLVVPGFVSDAFGALLLFSPTRALLRRWIARRYARRVMRFAATAARFAPRDRAVWPADVESTAVEDDPGQLDA